LTRSGGKFVPSRVMGPRKYRLGTCHFACKLNERNLPTGAAEVIHGWIEQGKNYEFVAAEAAEHNWPIPARSGFYNHKNNHLIPEDQMTEIGELPVEGAPLSDIQILERIIGAGASQLGGKTVRISPEMTMKAIELKIRLTQGNVMDNFLSAVDKAMGEEVADDGDPAVRGEDEAAQAVEA